MKIYKTSLIVALAVGGLLACSTLAFAQDTNQTKKGRGANIEQRMERLSTELNLTDAQKPKVKAVLEDTAKKLRDLRDVPREERREKTRPIMEEQNKKMKEILTPEQYDKFQKQAQQRRQRATDSKAETK